MMSQTKPKQLNRAVEFANKKFGNSTRTVAEIPTEVKEAWGLAYNDYVRVTVGAVDRQLKLGLAKLDDVGYGPYRNNDFKLTSGHEFGVPRHLVRALGISGDVWWESYDAQLVGSLTGYNNAHTLYKVVDYYTSREQFQTNEEQRLTFDQLSTFADTVFDGEYPLEMQKNVFRHSLPDTADFDEDEQRVFVVFYDGSEFVVALIPYTDAADHSFMRGALSASPESLYDSLPSDLLNYDKDTVRIRKTDDDNFGYTFPAQVGYCLSFDIGYTSNWLEIGGVYFARMRPNNSEQAEEQLTPTYTHQVSI